jgi:hypothetical protein
VDAFLAGGGVARQATLVLDGFSPKQRAGPWWAAVNVPPDDLHAPAVRQFQLRAARAGGLHAQPSFFALHDKPTGLGNTIRMDDLHFSVAACEARLLDLAWTGFPAGIIAE